MHGGKLHFCKEVTGNACQLVLFAPLSHFQKCMDLLVLYLEYTADVNYCCMGSYMTNLSAFYCMDIFLSVCVY